MPPIFFSIKVECLKFSQTLIMSPPQLAIRPGTTLAVVISTIWWFPNERRKLYPTCIWWWIAMNYCQPFWHESENQIDSTSLKREKLPANVNPIKRLNNNNIHHVPSQLVDSLLDQLFKFNLANYSNNSPIVSKQQSFSLGVTVSQTAQSIRITLDDLGWQRQYANREQSVAVQYIFRPAFRFLHSFWLSQRTHI